MKDISDSRDVGTTKKFKPELAGKIDRAYAEFSKVHPGISFTEWLWKRHSDDVRRGATHATLGANLKRSKDWKSAGLRMFEGYRTFKPITSGSRVIDYGCGSLRIGYHFIDFLEPQNYFGLEPIADLLDQGKSLIGYEALELKKPVLSVINEHSLQLAETFGADLVISASVAFHIPPNEIVSYLKCLRRITAKHQATLIFDAKTADCEQRYNRAAWARPISFFEQVLSPLVFVKNHHAQPYPGVPNVTNGHLEFRRP